MRTILVYLVLVGSPLVGLFAILHAGRRIVPPHHVGGEWVMAGGFAEAARNVCPDLVFPAEGAAMDVSQSGTRSRITLNDSAGTALDARLDGVELTARSEHGSGACGGRELRLRATLNSLPAREELRGAVSVAECSGCPAAPFRAVRAARTSTH